MTGRTAMGLAGAILLVLGCDTEAPAPPAAAEPQEPPAGTITAVHPEPGMQGVSRRPEFQWQLPQRLQAGYHATVLVAKAGTGEEPVVDEAGQERVAMATGLSLASPQTLDLWNPPAGCVVTGEVRDMSQLAPGTWYRWTVRVVGMNVSDRADFYFRTGDTPAGPGE